MHTYTHTQSHTEFNCMSKATIISKIGFRLFTNYPNGRCQRLERNFGKNRQHVKRNQIKRAKEVADKYWSTMAKADEKKWQKCVNSGEPSSQKNRR